MSILNNRSWSCKKCRILKLKFFNFRKINYIDFSQFFPVNKTDVICDISYIFHGIFVLLIYKCDITKYWIAFILYVCAKLYSHCIFAYKIMSCKVRGKNDSVALANYTKF